MPRLNQLETWEQFSARILRELEKKLEFKKPPPKKPPPKKKS